MTETTLVIGGNGKTGRRVAERLAERGRAVRIGSRSAARPFDWERPETWAAALEGVDSVYVTFYPDLSLPQAEPAIRAFAKLALSMGVRRGALLSGRGEEGAEACERAIREEGADWTIVRASWFMQNFSENFLAEAVLAGEVALPVDAVREPFVDADDIAEVVARSLTEDGHAGELYEVTGPRLLTFQEATAEIAHASGRELRFVSVPHDAYLAGLGAAGVPPEFVGLIDFLFREVLDGRGESLANGVERALGRPPRDFADYARDAAATGVWNVTAKEANRVAANDDESRVASAAEHDRESDRTRTAEAGARNGAADAVGTRAEGPARERAR